MNAPAAAELASTPLDAAPGLLSATGAAGSFASGHRTPVDPRALDHAGDVAGLDEEVREPAVRDTAASRPSNSRTTSPVKGFTVA